MGCETGNNLIFSWPYVKHFVDFYTCKPKCDAGENWTRSTDTACFILVPYFSSNSLRKPKVFELHILHRYLTKEGRVRKFFDCLYG